METSKKPEPGWLQLCLMPLGILAAVMLVLYFVVRPGGAPSPLVIGGVLAVAFLWVGVSVLWPARADRKCEQCGREGLERMDPQSAEGLICRHCGWQDATASAWYLAEEELEALEPLALARRAAKRDAGSAPAQGIVDKHPPSDYKES